MNQSSMAPGPQGGSSTMKWLLIILVIVIVLGGGYWLYAKYGKTSATTSTTSPSPASTIKASPSTSAAVSPSASSTVPADWKTYTNSTYNYSIKYPSDWVSSEPGAKRTVFATSAISGETDRKGLVEIQVPSLSKDDAMKEAFADLSGGSTNATIEKTSVGGVEATKYSGQPNLNVFGGGTHRIRVIFEKSGVVYVVEALDNNDSTIVSRFNQILSTFQFTP